jgi:hypothetical protein
MARYIKVNPKVARHLRLENDRNQVADGNYLLWQADMLAFGRLTEMPSILAQIGGLSLQAHEAREEQDGTVLRKLPIATDPRFAEDVQEPAEDTGAEDETDIPTPGDEAEDGESPTDEETEAGTQEPDDAENEAQEQPETETPNTDSTEEAKTEMATNEKNGDLTNEHSKHQ